MNVSLSLPKGSYIALALLMVSNWSCSNARLSTTRVAVLPYKTSSQLNPKETGFAFFWPRTEMQVEYGFSFVRYKAYSKATASGQKDVREYDEDKYAVIPASGEQALKITFSTSQDLDFGFVVPIDLIQSPYTDTKELKFGTDEKFMLTSVNGEFDDKKKDIIKSYLSTAVTVAKFAAGIVPKSADGKKDLYFESEVLTNYAFTIRDRAWISELLKKPSSKSGDGSLTCR